MQTSPRIAENYSHSDNAVASAESIALALGGRKTSRGWRAPCPPHDDRHPSLDLEARDGKVLLIDRSGRCTQTEVIDALRSRNLWPSRSTVSRPSRPIVDRFPASAFHEPAAPACCTAPRTDPPEPRCRHWLEFDAAMCVARLHVNLREAAGEVVTLFETARFQLSPEELRDELNLAVELGGSAIVPWHLSSGVVGKMIGVVVAEVLDSATD